MSVRDAGDKREQIPALGDVAVCRFVFFMDLFFNDLIGQGIPIVLNSDLVADTQTRNVIKEYPADVTRMPRQHTVGAFSADGERGICHVSGSESHVVIVSAEIDWKLQADRRCGDISVNAACDSIAAQIQRRLGVVIQKIYSEPFLILCIAFLPDLLT